MLFRFADRLGKCRRRKNLLTLTVVILSISWCHAAWAGNPAALKGRLVTEIDALGDATTAISIQASVQMYTLLKATTPNTQVLVQELGLTNGWGQLEDLQGKFHDGTSTIEIKFHQRGVCREVSEDRWVMSHFRWESGQVVATYGRELVLNQVMPSELGFATLVTIIKCPEGATDVRLDEERGELAFDFSPGLAEVGTDTAVELKVETKKNLMSSLAKCYSNSSFGDMWAARSVVRNVGDAAMDDFRIRFRVAELSAWSSWNRVHRVYPGQTVVDPFFPVFDLQKLATLSNSRTAMIEVEYSYRDAAGERTTETDSFPVPLLARNEAVFSSLPPEECSTFDDQFNNMDSLMASLTTPSDPVVQQLVGRIHGMASARLGHGVSASTANDDAIEYLRSIQHFISNAGIAYQTPPSLLVDGQSGQHIKYARDVLSNRAGTCIDLTVLWLSLMQAAGLEPLAVVVPGHVLPAVRLPEGGVIAIESTCLEGTLEEAVEQGMKHWEQAQQSDAIIVDIALRHAQGVTPLDLPELPIDFLDQMNYQFESREPVAPVREATSPSKEATGLEGTWSFSGRHGEVFAVLVLRIQPNDRVELYLELASEGQEPKRWTGNGTWTQQDGVLVLQMEAETLRWPYQLENDVLRVEVVELDTTFELERMALN